MRSQIARFQSFTWQINISFCVCVCVCVCVCNSVASPWTITCQAPVHGVFQAGILSWLPFHSPEDLPGPGIELVSPALVGGFFTS